MKKLILILLASCSVGNIMAQDSTKNKRDYTHDRDLSRWVLDINLLGGAFMQNFTTANSSASYLNEIPSLSNMGNLKFTNGSSFGGDAQIGFFFGKERHWGVGTGFMYLYQQGTAKLDNFTVQYQSTDANGDIFRQILTGDQVQEHISSTNINIPLLLKYKNRFSRRWGFTADAGLLFNLEMKNMYKSNSAFDYEAIYAYGEGNIPFYDNSPVPANTDFLITKAQFLAHNPDGNMQAYFNTLHSEGYNVGLGVPANNNSGSVSYMSGSVGFLVQPSMNYFLSDAVALNFGLYYLYQPFKNSAESGYMVTNKVGDYSSVLNNVTASNAQSFGLNVGVRFFLGKSEPPQTISSVESMPPTLCGTCDGSMTLHGLKPGKQVTVTYNFNGSPGAPYSGTVDANSNVIIPGLCAGSYTNITAKIGRHTLTGYTTNIVAPALVISSENPTNPSAQGKCDGTITFNGLYAGKAVTISYNYNGTSQAPYSGIVNSDNTVTLTGLCEGSYTGFVATINSCTANGTDVTLTAPVPPPPPPPPPPAPETPDISTPVLFDFDKSFVHPTYIPLIEEAAQEMKNDPYAIITVNGYTDAIGTKAYNKKLSVRRAQAVKNHLKKLGVSPQRVKVVGYGKTHYAAPNNTPEGRQQNRRAVMKLEDKNVKEDKK